VEIFERQLGVIVMRKAVSLIKSMEKMAARKVKSEPG